MIWPLVVAGTREAATCQVGGGGSHQAMACVAVVRNCLAMSWSSGTEITASSIRLLHSTLWKSRQQQQEGTGGDPSAIHSFITAGSRRCVRSCLRNEPADLRMVRRTWVPVGERWALNA